MSDNRFTDEQVYRMLRLMYIKGVNDCTELGPFEYSSTFDYECEVYTHQLFSMMEGEGDE